MTHRLYKDEYNGEFLRQLVRNRIPGLVATGEESEKVMIVEGEVEDLRKLSSLMYANPTQIKAVFPDFVTEEEYKLNWDKAYSNAFEAVRKEIVHACRYSVTVGYERTEAENELFNLFAEMRERVEAICRR